MKRVWLTFKILESILSLCCLGYHIRGFLNADHEEDHYIYITVFACFSLMAMFGSLNICIKKEKINPFCEGIFNLCAAVAFITISMHSMHDAKKDFRLISAQAQHQGQLLKSSHPLFKYSKAQSVAALCCGFLFLLHSILAFDFAFPDEDPDIVSSDDEYEDENENSQYIFLFVFGKDVQSWLEKFDCFNTLADTQKQLVTEKFLGRIKMDK